MKKLSLKKNDLSSLWALPLIAMLPLPVMAAVVSDTLTGVKSADFWVATGGACLTAGNGTPSAIPACSGLFYYDKKDQVGGVSGTLPDPVGQGALRLTNGARDGGSNGNNNTGSVISKTPFVITDGLQVTYSTVTYGGNGYNNGVANSGADGIAFFLLDATKQIAGQNPAPGAFGGSLGYSCANGKDAPDGVSGGYLAIGIDEYGNFSNSGDNGSTGDGKVHPGTLAVRGAGDTNWAALNKLYPTNYPASLATGDRVKAVQNTCKTGFLQNWSNGKNNGSTQTVVNNYNLIGSPVTVPQIYNQQKQATPLRSKANIFTYNLTITQDSKLSLSYNVNSGVATSVISKQSITAGNGALPASLLFGFTSGTGGGSNVHEILCFKAGPINTSAGSAGTNVQQSGRARSGSQVYLAYYHPLNSWGQLTASNILEDNTGVISVNPTANWDASCVLTGGTCVSTGVAATAQSPSLRTILTWNGTSGIPFLYDSLTTTQKNSLNDGNEDIGKKRVDFLRGGRTNEINNPNGFFRRRDGVLGDIINSSPTPVGPPRSSYAVTGLDLLSKTAIPELGTAYKTFTTNNAARLNMVYVGANDGMLHGFRSGKYSSTGVFDGTLNDGKEMISYLPAASVASIHTASTGLDFSAPQYAHNSYVDATPGTGDLYYSGAWHTWLVGGLGAGGNAGGAIGDNTSTSKGVLYAIDVTNPSNFSEANASTTILGEWGSNNLTCINNNNCKDNFGSVYGTPLIRRLHDGSWGVIFGNGRNSLNGTAGIFIMKVSSTGVKSFRFLNTGNASTDDKNGIDFVVADDLDGDRVTDYVYAGDLKGNIWRFDLTDSNPANWSSGASPIFSTPAGQPITTRLMINTVEQSSGPARRVISFGTGKKLPQTLDNEATYATAQQSFYGIWDWNMDSWNNKSSTKFLSLTSPQTITSATLQSQTMTDNGFTSDGIPSRTVSQNPVCWLGTLTCGTAAAANTKLGWSLNLDNSKNEQVIYNPVLTYGAILFNTAIPEVNQVLSCSSKPASGYSMAISPETGGALAKSPFTKYPGIAGLGLSATGSFSSIINTKGDVTGVSQTTSGLPVTLPLDPQTETKSRRVTWVKLR